MSGTVVDWEPVLTDWIMANQSVDPAHDIAHLSRVWANAKAIAAGEASAGRSSNDLVLLAACMLHDIVNPPKDHPDRPIASRRSAAKACEVLLDLGFSEDLLPDVSHAIEAHSFSGGIEPRSLEAMIVRDADRLEALGAIGIARCFTVSGMLGRTIAHPEDPLAERRLLDDKRYSLDHFEVKLFKLAGDMRTAAGRRIAAERTQFMKEFQTRLLAEFSGLA